MEGRVAWAQLRLTSGPGMALSEELGTRQEMAAEGVNGLGLVDVLVLGRKHWLITLISKVMKSKAPSSLGWEGTCNSFRAPSIH